MPKTKASLLVIAATAATVVTLFLLPFTPRTAVRTAVVERGELICSTLLEGLSPTRMNSPSSPCRRAGWGRCMYAKGRRCVRVSC